MAEYQVAVKTPKQSKPRASVCGDCGSPVARQELLCKECIEEARCNVSTTGFSAR